MPVKSNFWQDSSECPTLSLSFDNDISESERLQEISKIPETVRELQLDDSPPSKASLASYPTYLESIFRAIPPHIISLVLRGSSLNDECTSALEVLAHSSTLKYISFSNNLLRNEGAQILAKSPFRKIFSWANNGIGNEGAQALANNRLITTTMESALYVNMSEETRNMITEKNFLHSLHVLTSRARSETNASIQKSLLALLSQISKLKKSGTPLKYLVEILLDTESLLDGKNSTFNYCFKAKYHVSGKPSSDFKTVGKLMLALGAAIAATGLIILATPITLPVSMALVATGAASLALGAGFFAKSRQSGLSKNMDELGRAVDPRPIRI